MDKSNKHKSCSQRNFFPIAPSNFPAYGTFWQTQFITVPFAEAFPFNNTGRTAGGVLLLDPSTIRITQTGDYRVSFISTINTTLNPVFPHIPVISLRLNDAPLPNAQDDFGIQINNPNDLGCHQLTGETIIFIPANSTLQLINNSSFNSQNITTCDNGVNAVELTIIKVS
jgi:hypothetical protein